MVYFGLFKVMKWEHISLNFLQANLLHTVIRAAVRWRRRAGRWGLDASVWQQTGRPMRHDGLYTFIQIEKWLVLHAWFTISWLTCASRPYHTSSWGCTVPQIWADRWLKDSLAEPDIFSCLLFFIFLPLKASKQNSEFTSVNVNLSVNLLLEKHKTCVEIKV